MEKIKKTALITGASRGIGKAIATYFASKEYNLILIAKNYNTLENLKNTLNLTYGVNIQIISIDLTDAAQINTKLTSVLGELKQLDIVVNSAGVFKFGSSTLPLSDLNEMFLLNVQATHHICTLCLPLLKANLNKTYIFNLSSIAGVESFAPIAGYVASKHAIVGYSQSLAKEVINHNVSVVSLCPDTVNTDMAIPSGMPSDLMIEPEDLCKTIDFVLSLSNEAVVNQIVLRCKTLIEKENQR